MVLMYKPSVIDSPSGRSREKVPRWDLMGTEGCGGGKVVSWLLLMFLVFKSIYRRKKYVGGAPWGHEGGGRALPSRGCLGCFLTCTPSPLDHVRSKNHAPEGFIPFGVRLIFFFCKTLKQAKNSNLDWAFGLVGLS